MGVLGRRFFLALTATALACLSGGAAPCDAHALTVAARSFGATRAAESFSVADVKVVSSVGVPLRAVGLGGVGGSEALSSQRVLLWCYGAEVSRVHARPITAPVIDLESRRHDSDKVREGPRMGLDGLPVGAASCHRENAVTVAILGGGPQPASSLRVDLNFLHEAVDRGTRMRSHKENV